MFFKCIFLLLFINFINAQLYYQPSSQRCPQTRDPNMFTRMMQRGKFAKFSCFSRYTLVGNKYATCRNGRWDVALPVCIKSGCKPLPQVRNSVNQSFTDGAWLVFFCLPKYSMVGSSVVYCDGHRWNSTAPVCTFNSLAQTKTSCDFEEDLCGWQQDEMHSFDWRRINTKTPSSFMKTGPPYDHTLGAGGLGYYMYIESSSRSENDTARLLSPVYDETLSSKSCFTFYYHMYGRQIGGLRVYQKPDSVNLMDVLNHNEDGKNQYLLFEEWGNQGNLWFTGVCDLLDFNEDFQIVIEGIRGTGFISDIAIDDVAIMQGENCTNLRTYAATPSPPPSDSAYYSCAGRCGERGLNGQCNCEPNYCSDYSCCPDYLDICEFPYAPTSELRETQKLVSVPITANRTASTTDIIPPIISYSKTPRSSTTPPRNTTTPPRSTTTSPQKPTNSNSTTTTRTTSQPTSKAVSEKVTKLPTRTVKTTTPVNKIKTPKTTSRKSTTRATTRLVKPTVTKSTTTTRKPIVIRTTSTAPRTTVVKSTRKPSMYTKPSRNYTPVSKPISSSSKGSSGILPGVISVFVILLCGGVMYGVYFLRSSRGSLVLARLRGHRTRDPEVRFLKSDVDDDIDDE